MNLKSPVVLPKSMKFLYAGLVDEVVPTAGKTSLRWYQEEKTFSRHKSYSLVMPDSQWPVQISSFMWLCLLFTVSLPSSTQPLEFLSSSKTWCGKELLSPPHSQTLYAVLEQDLHCLLGLCLLSQSSLKVETGSHQSCPTTQLPLANVQWVFLLWHAVELN